MGRKPLTQGPLKIQQMTCRTKSKTKKIYFGAQMGLGALSFEKFSKFFKTLTNYQK